MRRWLTLAVLFAGQLILPASPSSACSCAGGDPREGFEAAEAAFVGTLIRVEELQPVNGILNGGQEVTWTFRVDRALKGSVGSTVDVESSWDGAACGLELEEGDRTGLFIWYDGGLWHSNLCAKVDPGLLIRAAEPLPLPDGTGPVRILVGGSYGDVRTIGLDSRGRTLAYGFGRGSTGLLSVCPGSKHVAEIASLVGQPPGKLILALRSLPTLRVEWETEIEAPTHAFRPFSATGLSCRNRDGTDVLVATHFRGRSPHGEILRFRKGEGRAVFRGPADWASFPPGDIVYVSGGRRIFAVDLGTGSSVHVREAPRGTGPFAVSPDGKRIAAVVDAFGARRSILLAERSSGRTHVAPIRDENVGGSVIWLDNGRILFSQIDGEEEMSYVYNTSLRRVNTLVGWNADSMAVASGVLYGLGSGQLHAVPVSGHQVEELRTFDSSEIRAIAAVPPAAGLEIPIIRKPSAPPERQIARDEEPESRERTRSAIGFTLAVAVAGGAMLLVRRHRRRTRG